MPHKIYPCLWFDGKAGEAAEFYCSIFNGSRVTVNTPMVVNFEIHGKKIMGLNGGPMYKINPSISLFVLCRDIDETNRVGALLLEGGAVLLPVDKYPWSERYGWLRDRYGMTWQVSVVNNPGDQPSITPSLLFTGNQFGRAAEAVMLYTGIFKNSSTDVFSPYPEGDANAGKLMYSEFKLDGCNLISMDGPGEHAYTFNEALSLVIDCNDQEEVDYYWDKLTANGGQESSCAWLKDKFGVSWQVVPGKLGELLGSPDREKSGRAMEAMLKMKKIIIADLQKAFDGE